MHRFNWDDLRFVLSVAESGSVSAAARQLGVNHATVLRRIAAFEAAQGTVIFDRAVQGYAVLPDKLRVIEAAREAQAAMAAVGRTIRGTEAQLAGAVRVTSTDTFCTAVLPAIVAELAGHSGALQIELLCTNAHLDLGRLNADISVRPALRLPEDMAGEKAGELGVAVYAAQGGGAAHWLGQRGAIGRSAPAAWVADNIAPDDVVGGADSYIVLRELVAAGQGRSFLPCCIAEGDTRLQRLAKAGPLIKVPIWVASHADLADAPRLRQVRARLVAALRARAGVLAGVS